MGQKKGGYAADLKNGLLDERALDSLENLLKKHLTLEDVSPELLGKWKGRAAIPIDLRRLRLHVARYRKDSWEGLVVGFPGELTTEYVTTPFLRKLLYSILELHRRLQESTGDRQPCIYILGRRFPDVFHRKFALLDEVTPHTIVLTADIVPKLTPKFAPPSRYVGNEYDVQGLLNQQLRMPAGLRVPTACGESLNLAYVAHEVACWEGTKEPERLDILCRNIDDKSLVAFELKGPNPQRTELENLFLQGIEHRNWLEANKMALKFTFDGPLGTQINTRKRTRLVLGFFGDHVPTLFEELRAQATRKDKYISIDFVRLHIEPGPRIAATRFPNAALS